MHFTLISEHVYRGMLARRRKEEGVFFKIDHFALLAKEMSTHVVMLLMAYLMLLGASRK